jgi:hypothetical protein
MGGPSVQATTARPLNRIIGVYEGRRPGRTVIAIGGMHGNEPAGIKAITAVLTELRERDVDMAGTLVGVVGNVQALAAEQRFVEHDLNRGWTPQTCERVKTPRPDESPEDAEQRGLLEVFGPLEAESDHPLVFLDLHSTSGPAAPFSIIPDVARNRELALQLPIPTVLGLEEILEGVMFGYLVDRGHMGVAVEGGQHDDPETTARLEGVIWLSLIATGSLRAHDVPEREQHRARLRKASAGLPTAVRMLHRHGVDDDGFFEMEPGFRNFGPVRRGQQVARNQHGPVVATVDGLVMLPRYQGQGSDGFFLATRVTRRWLMLSALVRKGRMSRFLALWPGLRWEPRTPNRLRYSGTEPSRTMLRALRLLGFHGVRARPPGLEFFRRQP